MQKRPVYPITIVESEDFYLNFTWEIDGVGVDLSDYTALMQVRKNKSTGADLIVQASDTGGETEGDITLDDAGNVQVHIPAELIEGLDVPKEAYFDVMLISAGNIPYRKLQGPVTYDPATSTTEESSP